MRLVDAKAAMQLIAEKQSVEVQLSLDVQEIFDGMIPDLRLMCQESIVEVDKMAKIKKGFAKLYSKKWTSYGCMKNMKEWDATTLIHHSESWNTSDCGDWIRVYGEIIEIKTFFGFDQEEERTKPQLGDKKYWSKPTVPAPEVIQGPSGQYTKVSGNQSLSQPNLQPDALRRRVEFHTLTTDDQGLYKLETTESGFLMKSMPSSGIKKWAIMAEDVTGKMARVFGLMKGATISGTTTDNIYFLKRKFAAIWDPILYLLPIGSIVGGGHHSLLEVTIPLTMNKLMDYSVGLYSTLIPRVDHPRTALRKKGADELKRVCDLAEKHEHNHLLLCYFDAEGQLAGAYVADKIKNKTDWLRAFKADESLMNAFANMAISPTVEQLYNFMLLRRIRWTT